MYTHFHDNQIINKDFKIYRVSKEGGGGGDRGKGQREPFSIVQFENFTIE